MSKTRSEEGVIDVHVHMNPFWRMKDGAKQTMREHSSNYDRSVEQRDSPNGLSTISIRRTFPLPQSSIT